MRQLVGLPGVAKPVDSFAYITNTTEGMRELTTHRAITAVGMAGQITIWKRDDHEYGCERFAFKEKQAEDTLPSLRAVRMWLRDNIKHIY